MAEPSKVDPDRSLPFDDVAPAADAVDQRDAAMPTTHQGFGPLKSEVQTTKPPVLVEGPPFETLDPRHIPADRIANSIFSGVVVIGSMVGFAVRLFVSGFNIWTWLLAIGLILLCLLVAVAGWIWPNLEHRFTRWRLTKIGFEIRRGVIWRHQISVPAARVQHADVSQGPLQRQFGLGTLTMHTAGTQNASVELGGLDHRLAIVLRDQLIRQRKASDVV